MTIPKHLADKKGIKPGDVVSFEETPEGIMLRRGAESERVKVEELRKIIDSFVADVPKLRRHLRKSKRAINENLSRHIPA